MHRPPAGAAGPLALRFAAFVTERFPLVAAAAVDAFATAGGAAADSEAAIEAMRAPLTAALRRLFAGRGRTRRKSRRGSRPRRGRRSAVDEIVEACDGFLRRAAIARLADAAERREILRGMLLTRATDNRLKTFFTSGEVRFRDATFQGKGFRSLGQEAIYAAGIRLRRGAGLPRRTGSGAAMWWRR